MLKQSVINQMKEYQYRKKIIKGIEYQEGMEDAWLVEYEEYIEDNDNAKRVNCDKIFWTKSDAEEYMKQEHPEDNQRGLFCKYTRAIPVLLRGISVEDYDSRIAIAQDGKYFEYEELDEGYWIYIENGYVYTTYDSEAFFNDFEPLCINEIFAHIGYDRENEELYVGMNGVKVTIDETEVATVEKLLEGFEIPFTEKIGQVFYK